MTHVVVTVLEQEVNTRFVNGLLRPYLNVTVFVSVILLLNTATIQCLTPHKELSGPTDSCSRSRCTFMKHVHVHRGLTSAVRQGR